MTVYLSFSVRFLWRNVQTKNTFLPFSENESGISLSNSVIGLLGVPLFHWKLILYHSDAEVVPSEERYK